MPSPRRLFARYFLAAAILTTVTVAAPFSVNSIIDPLWYFNGNQLFPANYSFNERLAKTNRFLRLVDDLDCVIFGSSRVTLLDESEIKRFRCFNFAVSGGQPVEYPFFARYVRKMGLAPKQVIVGVDEWHFWYQVTPSIPDFIRSGERPRPAWQAYLSLDVLKFSIRAILRRPPLPRYYDDEFLGDIIEDHPEFTPPADLRDVELAGPFTLDVLPIYEELRAIFPDATFVGYAPPISAWHVARMHQGRTYENYLDVIYTVSQTFDRFYDFTMPSWVTSDPSATYDWQHYMRTFNKQIARTLDGHPASFGIAVHDLSEAEYRALHYAALRDFLVRSGLDEQVELPEP